MDQTAAVRLATFNVLHGRSVHDGRVDVDRFARAVRRLDADVLALQEVDRCQPRSSGRDLTAVAAEAMGATAARFLPALVGEPDTWSAPRGGEPPDSPAYGVALLSRLPVQAWRAVRLPALPMRVPVLFRGQRRPVLADDEPRVALLAELDGLTVAATHLSFVPGWNVVQLARLARALRGPDAAVLMGDLNMGPSPASRTSGLQPLAVGPTFPADAPQRQLDHVLARGLPRPAVLGGPVELDLSDHRALVVDLPGR